MKKRRLTTRRDIQSKALMTLLENEPEARKTEARYKVIRYILRNYFPQLYELYPKETIEQLFRDVVYLDRKHRKLTEGNQKELKKILSQKFQIEELDMRVGYYQDIKLVERLSP